MQRSETIGELAKALAAANGHIKNPNLDAVNPHFKSRYASLGAIINAVRAPLAAQGISAVQTVSNDGGSVGVTTTLLHSSGEWMAETIWSAPARSGYGSAVGVEHHLFASLLACSHYWHCRRRGR